MHVKQYRRDFNVANTYRVNISRNFCENLFTAQAQQKHALLCGNFGFYCFHNNFSRTHTCYLFIDYSYICMLLNKLLHSNIVHVLEFLIMSFSICGKNMRTSWRSTRKKLEKNFSLLLETLHSQFPLILIQLSEAGNENKDSYPSHNYIPIFSNIITFMFTLIEDHHENYKKSLDEFKLDRSMHFYCSVQYFMTLLNKPINGYENEWNYVLEIWHKLL